MTTAGLLGILSKKIYIIPTLVLLAHTHTTQRPNIRQPQPQFLSNLGATRLIDALFDYKDTFIIFVLNALGFFFLPWVFCPFAMRFIRLQECILPIKRTQCESQSADTVIKLFI